LSLIWFIFHTIETYLLTAAQNVSNEIFNLCLFNQEMQPAVQLPNLGLQICCLAANRKLASPDEQAGRPSLQPAETAQT